MELLHKTINEHEFFYRDITGDRYVLRENLGNSNVYLKRAPVKSSDIVLDLGGHIGTFAAAVAPHVKMVYTFEPNMESFSILKKNMEPYPNVKCFELAVISATQKDILYFPANGTDQGMGSLHKQRGRKSYWVKTVDLDSILLAYKPTYIKCDIEGEEYDLFCDRQIPTQVRVISFEVHFGKKQWHEVAYPQLLKNLRSQGFEFPTLVHEKQWALIFSATRKVKK